MENTQKFWKNGPLFGDIFFRKWDPWLGICCEKVTHKNIISPYILTQLARPLKFCAIGHDEIIQCICNQKHIWVLRKAFTTGIHNNLYLNRFAVGQVWNCQAFVRSSSDFFRTNKLLIVWLIVTGCSKRKMYLVSDKLSLTSDDWLALSWHTWQSIIDLHFHLHISAILVKLCQMIFGH